MKIHYFTHFPPTVFSEHIGEEVAFIVFPNNCSKRNYSKNKSLIMNEDLVFIVIIAWSQN